MSRPFKLGRLTRKRADGSSQWSYCVTWWEPQGRRRYSLDTQDQPTAEAKARQVYADRDKDKAAADTVGVCVGLYLDSLGGQGDEKRKREAWKAAQGFWAAIPVAVVDEGLSASYQQWRAKSINTMRNELSLIRTALHWMCGKDNAPKVIVPGIPPSDVGHLTKAEFRDFLAGCASPHVKLFSILGVTTGARKSALLEAKWDQVDFDRCQLNLNAAGRVQSHKKRALVALNDRAMEALREAKAGATTEYVVEFRGDRLRDIKKGIAAAADRTGIKVHPHMFRHSAAVWMAEARVPMAEIASFLGHSNVHTTTSIYARYHPDHLRQAAGALTW
ncbi:tyrosine-type recombinase/integrase [Sphingobium sp. ZW T5_29]|uniref:tyrosine-type recombinase/integrase n=1 Tax=Sphingobium sp. ZW T5_29 TaxID=3378077 RepID=UPI00385207BE